MLNTYAAYVNSFLSNILNNFDRRFSIYVKNPFYIAQKPPQPRQPFCQLGGTNYLYDFLYKNPTGLLEKPSRLSIFYSKFRCLLEKPSRLKIFEQGTDFALANLPAYLKNLAG